jgi:cell division protein FtsL
MPNNTSSQLHRRHRRKHRSSSVQRKKVAEEITAETLSKFVRKHKTLVTIACVGITVLLSFYVFVHMIAPSVE